MEEHYQHLHSLYDKLIQESEEKLYSHLKDTLCKCSCEELDYIELQLKTALSGMQEGSLVQNVIPTVVSIAAMLLSIFSVLLENMSRKEFGILMCVLVVAVTFVILLSFLMDEKRKAIKKKYSYILQLEEKVRLESGKEA